MLLSTSHREISTCAIENLLSHFSNIKHFRPRVFQHLSHYSVGGPISRDLPAAVFNLQRSIANMENTDKFADQCRM